jgi:hypothetical protein
MGKGPFLFAKVSPSCFSVGLQKDKGKTRYAQAVSGGTRSEHRNGIYVVSPKIAFQLKGQAAWGKGLVSRRLFANNPNDPTSSCAH